MHGVNVGLIGAGTVGTGVARNLLDHGGRLSQRVGSRIRLAKVCSRHRSTIQQLRVRPSLWTRHARDIVRDPQIDIVVELIGGIHPAKEYVLEALQRGKHVVTANKALLAQCGRVLFDAAHRHGVELLFEAAVAGGVPIIKTLRDGLVGNDVDTVLGIINGTSNYILSQMAQEGVSFQTALEEAQRRGYAERVPTLDVSGRDAAHKLAIIALLAFGRSVRPEDIHVEGIQQVQPIDLQYAAEFGYVIKPLAIAKRADRALELRVHPTLLKCDHVLANVQGVYNAVYVHGDLVGAQLLYGKGAGQRPTASAVVSDLAEVARHVTSGTAPRTSVRSFYANRLRLRPMGVVEGCYYLRFSVTDRPGVLAKIAAILGRHHISISTVTQPARREARTVPVIIMTHEAQERNIRRALIAIDRLSVVRKKTVVLRIETPTR